MSSSTVDLFTPPATQEGIVADSNGLPVVSTEAPCPPLNPDQVYVRTEAVAINPSDTKMVGDFVIPNALYGADYAGTVMAVGSHVQGIKAGERICGAQHSMHAGTPFNGAFGRFNVTNGHVWLKLPAGWSSEAGSTLGASVSTAGLAIRALGLPLPDEPLKVPAKVLVYGASTATGTIAIQLLKLANLVPIAVCSPKNFDLAKSRGAVEAFDYRDPECGDKIRTYTSSNLTYALDCITTVESTKACFRAIGRGGGRYVSLDPFQEHVATRKVVKTDWVLGPAIFGHGSTWPAPYMRPGDPELKEFAAKLWAVAQKLIDEGRLQHHPLHLLQGGFDMVIKGMELVKKGQVSGEKVVVRLS
ncbi:putative secondary metabolism biosynthetic enzyme [Pyricularia oryzae]|nr:putative secondary metabolism biosynthetic enzyme [Pyricularia oryzae]KAI6283408.1 putative secondary metabolism biosynthetic enzyme [Pyricularia oryzae]KAI6385512.1 putative secondary metabolism biosynthetic enzyme [Pyricularia oryzae]KAI6446917.1 putative secondary metabolism biosynthetic enzyme [Pyricularia oryzae]KAI6544251.1 putative secondary metabolism biosynthetic enzyme [Pyricularia oryzae]